MKKKSPDHVVLRNDDGAFYCRNCGYSYKMALPVELSIMIAAMEAFVERHKLCKISV